MQSTDDDARARAIDFAKHIAAFWEDQLGAELLGFYLIGSLAHNGFNRRYSDIDVALIAENALSETKLAAMRAEAARHSPDLTPKLSLFWADREFAVGRFPPLDRLDLINHPVIIVEREAVRPKRPTLTEIHTYLRGAPFDNWSKAVRRFAVLDVLDPADHKPYLRAHLYPARFAFSWLTGEIASNDDAVAYLNDKPPAGLDMGLIDRALKCRQDAADPDGLFPDRTALPRQLDACAQLVAGS